MRNEHDGRLEKIRKGFWDKAENDVAETLGFRVKRINGEVFLVYREHQEVVPHLAGEALLAMWGFATKQKYNTRTTYSG